MTDEQRLQMITEQLILVRDNLFRGMSKSMQKLQARSINEVLELPNHTSPPQRTWVNATTWRGLTDEEQKTISDLASANDWHDFDVMDATETKLKAKNSL